MSSLWRRQRHIYDIRTIIMWQQMGRVFQQVWGTWWVWHNRKENAPWCQFWHGDWHSAGNASNHLNYHVYFTRSIKYDCMLFICNIIKYVLINIFNSITSRVTNCSTNILKWYIWRTELHCLTEATNQPLTKPLTRGSWISTF